MVPVSLAYRLLGGAVEKEQYAGQPSPFQRWCGITNQVYLLLVVVQGSFWSLHSQMPSAIVGYGTHLDWFVLRLRCMLLLPSGQDVVFWYVRLNLKVNICQSPRKLDMPAVLQGVQFKRAGSS
jgi:hypothetical protein